MACLVPQFKCPASSDAYAHSRIFHHSLHSASAANARILVRFETHCTASQMTAVIEKLQMPAMEAHPFALTCMSPLTYVGGIGPPKNKIFEENLTREEILTSEEAVIAAAAAEAITLAKAAVKFARAAALLLQNSPSMKFDKTNEHASGEEKLRPEVVKRSESKKIGQVSHSAKEVETEPKEANLHSLPLPPQPSHTFCRLFLLQIASTHPFPVHHMALSFSGRFHATFSFSSSSIFSAIIARFMNSSDSNCTCYFHPVYFRPQLASS